MSGFDGYREYREHADRYTDLNNDSFEARSLEFLMTRFGLKKQIPIFKRRCADLTGKFHLRFVDFHNEYPSFPVYLGSERIPGIHTDARCFLPALFKNFDQTPFVSAYEQLYERLEPVAEGRAIGLIFNRKGISRGLVIHDGVDLPQRVFAGLSFVYQGGRKNIRRLFVQPYQTLVDQLHHGGHGWRP